jgi:hypothetical protein
LDATFAFDWSPPNVNRNYTQLTAGLRFNEPLPLGFHNTMSLGYVQNVLSSQFLLPGMPAWKTEHGVEFNILMLSGPLLIQPVIQYYANVGGIGGARFRCRIQDEVGLISPRYRATTRLRALGLVWAFTSPQSRAKSDWRDRPRPAPDGPEIQEQD